MTATLLGIDIGTSLIKAAPVNGRAVCLAAAETPVSTMMPEAGTAEQDTSAILAHVFRLIREIAERQPAAARHVAAIGASGQTAGAMAVDGGGAALTPWYPSGLDTRFLGQLAEMKAKVGPALFASNGAWPFMTPRLAWWRDVMPQVYARIAMAPSLAGFVLGSMAEDALPAMAMDATTMTWSGAADIAHRRWNRDLVRDAGLSPDMLAPDVPSLSIVGHLGERAAKRAGLRQGIPLAVGIGDTVASMIGANVLTPGEVYSVNGSFTNYLVCLDRCLIDQDTERFQPLASPVDDVWYVILYIAGGGFVHHRLAGLLSGGEGPPDYRMLDDAAALIAPGSDGLCFMPYALGRFCPPEPRASAGFHGLTLAHGRGAIWRSVLEGLSYDMLELTDGVSARIEGWRPQALRLTGGGARSALWCQMQADMLGVPAQRFSAADSAPIGAALAAGTATGIWGDLRQAAAQLRIPGESFAPDRTRTEAYARLVGRHRRLAEALKPSWSHLTGH
jgi:xylulokinase